MPGPTATHKVSESYAGVPLRHPYLLAASPLTADAEHILVAARAGWAGAVTKTITAHPQFERNLTPSMSFFRAPGGTLVGLGNNEIRTHLGLDRWVRDEFPTIKREAPPGFVLVASLAEGEDPGDWVKTAIALHSAGADALELNVSCPPKSVRARQGLLPASNHLFEVVRACVQSVSIPVSVKISAALENPRATALLLEKAGAQGISCSNTLPAILAVDIDHFVVNPPGDASYRSTIMGYSGPGIRPLVMRTIAALADVPGLHLSAVGGVDSCEAALEYISLGADSVQVCTAAMLGGCGIITPLLQSLQSYLNRTGMRDTQAIRGRALASLVDVEVGSETFCREIAKIQDGKCNACGCCIEICVNCASGAIQMDGDGVSIAADRCNGCGFCVGLCEKRAIEMSISGQ